jgi:hypothetical protein
MNRQANPPNPDNALHFPRLTAKRQTPGSFLGALFVIDFNMLH